jgi:hypothetical protein
LEYGDSGAWVSSSPDYAQNWGAGNKNVFYTDVPVGELPLGVQDQYETNGLIPNFQLSPKQTAGLKPYSVARSGGATPSVFGTTLNTVSRFLPPWAQAGIAAGRVMWPTSTAPPSMDEAPQWSWPRQ